ncbi:hypothetical protein BC952_2624 [Flavobacterium limicola]|uniref:TonB-dependent receptor plug domain-containing protein n=1 Tax=Flavobacterium limicola TaxID=180441 RepID=A0A495RZF8_9FLAO|nr:hypothetical protein [Flavobacterium limicola]RKS92709.1 hypothetical protein BC952_2624 [Flavobacterium limicola]
MKKITLSIFLFFVFGCAAKKHGNIHLKEYVFILNENDASKFYFIKTVKDAYNEGAFVNSPIVAIDGIVLEYKKDLDTIVLPLKKHEITNVQLLHKNSSSAIYGKRKNNGAIIINTINLK